MLRGNQSGTASQFELLERREMFSATPWQVTPVATGHNSTAIEVAAVSLHRADAVAGTGLTAEYFSDAGFANAKLIRTDATVNLKSNSKDKITKKSSSVIWSGTIVPRYTEPYTFSTTTKGGSQLTVNDQTIINQLQGAGGTIVGNSTVNLVAGQQYDISFSYVRHGGSAAAQLKWQSPSQALEVVPQSALFPSTAPPTLPVVNGALIGQYYSGENFDQLVMTRSDPNINFNFGTAAPAASIPANTPFSIRWTGQIKPAKSGTYTFASKSDDGIRVWVDGNLVIDDYHDQAAVNVSKGTISLNAGQAYTLRVDYYQNGQGVGSVKLQYSLPGGKALNVIPSALLSSVTPSTAGLLSTTHIAADEVDLTWTGSSTATGYEVDRLDASGNWDDIAQTTPGTTTFSDTGLTPGTEYDYRVEPLGSSMASSQSNVLSAQTLTQTPGAPTVTRASAVDVDLNWADVAGETGFIVLDSTDGGQTFSPIGVTPQGVLSYDAVGLTPGTDYQFAVEALNAGGEPSAASTPVEQTTPLLPPLSLTAVSTSSTAARLQWSDVTGETGFVVERTHTGDSGWATVATLPAGTLTYTDSGLSGGTLYSYRVRSLDNGGPSSPSVTATALTIPSVVTPTLTDLNVTTSSVSFPAVTGATSYVVQRSMDGFTGWTTVATVTPPAAPASVFAGPVLSPAIAGTTLSATVPNVAPSTVYYYRVTASNSAGTSAPSAVVSQMSAPLAMYSTDNQLYGLSTTNGTSSVFDLNMTAGTSTLVGQMLPGAFAANRNSVSGLVYYAVGTGVSPEFYAWDPTTGNNTAVGSLTFLSPLTRAANDSTGTAWYTDSTNHLYKITPNGYSVVNIGTMTLNGLPMTAGAGNMVFSPTGALYLANGGTIYTVNTSTAALTPYVTLGLGNVNIVYGNSGTLYSTDSNGREYSVSSVAATLIPNSSLPVFNSLTASPAFVDLGVTATASPTVFTHGQNAAYSINVSNTGANAVDVGSITVTATLGSGLSFTSVSGAGWTATSTVSTLNITTVTMTYSGGLIVNGNAPTLTLNVHVASSAVAGTTTTFTVANDQFDTGVLNNTAVVTNTIA